VAKAKALKKYVEPLITKSKEDTTHNRRIVFSYLEDKNAVSELFREIAVKIGDRPGGYTRILRTGIRLGDNAEMCIIELVDYNEAMLESKDAKKKTSRRSRSRSKSTGEKAPETKAVVKEEKELAVEEIVEKPVKEVKEEVVEVVAEVEEVKEEKTEENTEKDDEKK
jgi:large subunit ribosomal protein L17